MIEVTKTADDAGDSYTEEDVRRLLRSLRRPDLAAANPLGRHLCEVFGTASPLQAVRLLVDITFSGQGHAGARLADLIRKGDIEGQLSHAGIAAEMGLSLRQFFRHRARAVALLTNRVQTLVNGTLSSFHCLEMLADMVATTNAASAAAIYELLTGAEENEQLIHRMRLQVDAGFDIPDAWVNETPEPWKIIAHLLQIRSLVVNGNTNQAQAKLRKLHERLAEPQILSKEIQAAMLTTDAIRARQRHDPVKLQAVAKRLFETGASDHETAVTALLLEAEGALRAGDTNLAESLAREIRRMARASRDIRAAGRVTLLCANIALVANSLNEADELATGAFYALQQQPLDASLCQMTIGRARLPLGKRWQLVPDVVLRPEAAWDRIGLQIIGARYMLRDAKFEEAEELVQRLLDLAQANRYDGLAAHALATLAACYGAVRNERAEQDAYIEAWRFYARCSDRVVGADLFTAPFVRPRDIGPIIMSDAFLAAITEHAKRYVPEIHSTDAETLNAFWRDAIQFANSGTGLRLVDVAALSKAVDRCALEPLYKFATQRCGFDLASLLPFDRREAWISRWRQYAAVLR